MTANKTVDCDFHSEYVYFDGYSVGGGSVTLNNTGPYILASVFF